MLGKRREVKGEEGSQGLGIAAIANVPVLLQKPIKTMTLS